jgi:hypothetical protein
MDRKNNHCLLVDGVFDILEAFPSIEGELKGFITSFILREMKGAEFDSVVKAACLSHIKRQTQAIKQGVKDESLYNAYYDVARYLTDPKDAAAEWCVDEEILNFLLERRPPPQTTQERLSLIVPYEVTKRRVLREDYPL